MHPNIIILDYRCAFPLRGGRLVTYEVDMPPARGHHFQAHERNVPK